MNPKYIFVLAASALLTSCSALSALFGGPNPSEVVQQIADEAAKLPATEPTHIAGFDIIELVVYALAALGLPSVARVVLALKPVLVIVVRAVLGKTAPATTPEQPSTTPPPEAKP